MEEEYSHCHEHVKTVKHSWSVSKSQQVYTCTIATSLLSSIAFYSYSLFPEVVRYAGGIISYELGAGMVGCCTAELPRMRFD